MQPAVYPPDAAAPVDARTRPGSYIHWGSIIAGALVAASVSFVLLTFGTSIGLSISSPSPTWRNASVGLALLSGVWLLVVAIGTNALGGYIAGRMRTTLAPAHSDEVEFRDGVHGAVAWALAVIIAALVTMATARMLAPAYAEREASTPPTTMAGVGEPRFVSYEIDKLLRGERRPTDAVDLDAGRGEIGRLLMAALDERNFVPEDRVHLIRLVAARTGLAPADAERRADAIVAQTRQKANRARRSAVVLAFMTAASLVLGLTVAWFAAGVGGRHRDSDTVPSLLWQHPTVKLG